MSSRRTLPLCLASAALIVASAALVGCRNKPAGWATAEEAAKAFADAMNARDYAKAARVFDYVEAARQQNENWDEIPPGQRDLIIKSLAENRAKQLAQLGQRLGGNIRPGPLVGGTSVTLTGDAGSVSLELRQRHGRWWATNLW